MNENVRVYTLTIPMLFTSIDMHVKWVIIGMRMRPMETKLTHGDKFEDEKVKCYIQGTMNKNSQASRWDRCLYFFFISKYACLKYHQNIIKLTMISDI